MKDGHVSGFHDASPEEWKTLFEGVSKVGTSVVGATECRGDVAPFNWNQWRPKGMDGAECSILWDRDTWGQVMPALDHRGGLRLTALTFFTGKGHERPGVVATWALLRRHRDNLLLLRVVAHFPASVQAGDRFSRKTRRRLAWLDALRGLRREVRRLRRELGPAEVTVSCDWNVDLTRKAWRRLINTALRGTGLRLKPPTEGTHGRRAIDAHATTLRAQAVHVLKPASGFDHRPVVAVLDPKESRHVHS